jgi:hypothetical protein
VLLDPKGTSAPRIPRYWMTIIVIIIIISIIIVIIIIIIIIELNWIRLHW